MASKCKSRSAKAIPYCPPKWALGLKNIPQVVIPLLPKNINIKSWNLPDVPKSFEVFIRKEDADGCALSGNKVKNLEFLLADAMIKNCKHVVTCGHKQSNHCRSTALAAKELGMTPHLLISEDVKSIEDLGSEGNMLLYRMCGAHMYIIPKQSLVSDKVKLTMEKLAKSIREETQQECYVIPVGGSNHVGIFGFISVFSEIEPMISDITDIVVACGSGGTASGLSIANYLTGSKFKMHAVIVSHHSIEYFRHYLNEELSYVGLKDVKSDDILDIIEGYGRVHMGNMLSTEEELEFIMNIGAETGVMLDPVYTGKAARGLVMELNRNPGRFKGTKILFIHTGGIFNLFDGQMNQPLISRKTSNSSRIRMWIDKEEDRSSE